MFQAFLRLNPTNYFWGAEHSGKVIFGFRKISFFSCIKVMFLFGRIFWFALRSPNVLLTFVMWESFEDLRTTFVMEKPFQNLWGMFGERSC